MIVPPTPHVPLRPQAPAPAASPIACAQPGVPARKLTAAATFLAFGPCCHRLAQQALQDLTRRVTRQLAADDQLLRYLEARELVPAVLLQRFEREGLAR